MRLAEIFVGVRGDTRTLPGDIRKGLSRSNVGRMGKDEGHKFARGFGSGLSKLAVVAGGALAGLAIGRKITESVDAASDLNETINKSNTIFGKNAAGIERWSRTSATAFGLSKNSALASAASFGDMFSQLGFASGAAANMSKSTVQMAADLGSFNNLGTEDVLERIAAGFRGEFDSLQAVIPNISAARVQTEALAASGKKNASELTAQEKATAVLAIIQKDGARAMGDFAKTSGGYANQQKIAAAQTADLKTKLGQGLLPVFVAGSVVLNTQLLPPLIALATEHGPAVSEWLTDVTKKAGPFVTDFLAKAGPMFKSLTEGTNEASPALASLADSGQKLAPVVQQLLEKIPSLSDMLTIGATAIGFFADHADTLAKLMPLLVAAIVAYKVAQLAGNVAALLSVPVKFSEVIVNRQLVKSNRELIASRSGVVASTVAETVATGANTGAKSAGVLATTRLRVASIAHAVSSKAIAAATVAWTAAQWLLNFALTANPIGLVIVAGVALAALFVLLWKRSSTFRTVVTAAFNGFKLIALTVITFVWRLISGFFDNLLTGAARAFGWVPGIGGKLRTAATEFGKFKDSVNRQLDRLKDQTVNVTPNIKNVTFQGRTVPLNQIGSFGRLATGGKADGFKVNGPGTTTNDRAGLFALSTKEWVINAMASQRQGDDKMRMLNEGKASIVPDAYAATGGKAGVLLRGKFPSPRGLSVWQNEVMAHTLNAARPAMLTAAHATAQNALNQAYAAGGDAGPPGARRSYRGVTLNARTIRMLLVAERILGSMFRITQGSYSTRVAASGGTHSGGGAMDTNSAGKGWYSAQVALRRAGFAAWVRTPSQGPWAQHIHSIALGDPTASPSAKRQMASFKRGGTGLGMAEGGKADDFMSKGFLKRMGVKIFDGGGNFPPGTLGANLSSRNETVVAGGNGDGSVQLDRYTMRELARLFAEAVSNAPIKLDSHRVDAGFAGAALGVRA